MSRPMHLQQRRGRDEISELAPHLSGLVAERQALLLLRPDTASAIWHSLKRRKSSAATACPCKRGLAAQSIRALKMPCEAEH